MKSLYPKKEFKKLPVEDRIELVIVDGMWYSIAKWKKLAAVEDYEIEAWIEKHLADGSLVQSDTGARSYRYPLESIEKWHKEHNVAIGTQLVDFVFPPRIWAGMTEVEGFLDAPLREIAIVSFDSSPDVAARAVECLRGIARVREDKPGSYKAYGLNASYIKSKLQELFDEYDHHKVQKMYARSVFRRRELADFDPEFINGLIEFYKDFSKSLVRKSKETIQIFFPEQEDQNSQLIIWIITAIEKFDDEASVPFSGYLDSVLRRWPFDLPYNFLGKELSSFQRERHKAIAKMKKERGVDEDHIFSAQEIASAMGIEKRSFNDLEERHQTWARVKNATTLTWTESSDEKSSSSFIVSQDGSSEESSTQAFDVEVASHLSFAVIKAAINTAEFDMAFKVIEQIDSSDIRPEELEGMSKEFIKEMAIYFSEASERS